MTEGAKIVEAWEVEDEHGGVALTTLERDTLIARIDAALAAALAAQYAALAEQAKRHAEWQAEARWALHRYAEWFAGDGFHDNGCPLDDTCDCADAMRLNALWTAPATEEAKR
jgi:hypothetical protein